MLTWPSSLPDPDSKSFRLTITDTTQRTPMGKGYVRTRQTSKNAPVNIECSWTLTGEQKELLFAFYRMGLHEGADSFLWPCPYGAGYALQQVLFTEPPDFTYADPKEWVAKGKMVVQNDFGPVLWVDVLHTPADGDSVEVSDKNVAISLGSLTGFTPTRVDVFIRNAPNSVTSDVLRVGYTSGADQDKLVDDVSLTGDSHLIITPGSAGAGTLMGTHQAGTKELVVKWVSTTSGITYPNKCDLSVVVRYEKD
jgi:hypothetical protein